MSSLVIGLPGTAGVPAGAVSLKARNWREMLELARSAALLPAPVTDTVEGTLELMASLSGNPDDLDVQLALRDGLISTIRPNVISVDKAT